VWDEESGQLHRELEGFGGFCVSALASFLSPDGQQPRLVVGSGSGHVRVYDPEEGSMLHGLAGHDGLITSLACIASSSAAPQGPRVVSTSWDGTAKVWDGETGVRLANLRGHQEVFISVVVWKEHRGGHDRIATTGDDGRLKVWDGEAFTLLRDVRQRGGHATTQLLPFKSAEGAHRLLTSGQRVEVWDPEEGRLLHDGINIHRGCRADHCHLFESAQGCHLLAITSRSHHHPRHPGDTVRAFLDVWDLGEAPAREGHVRGAHKHG
jgi:hypothetical protein